MIEAVGIDFEPEIELPAHPFEAARVFLAAMAYPERGAGQPGGLGVRFCESLWSRMVWSRRKAWGLRKIREELGDPNFKPPELREFEGAYLRGKRRLRRRSVAYSLVGTQMLNGFFAARAAAARLIAEGRDDEAFALRPSAKFRPIKPELWTQNTRTPRQVIKSDLVRWAERFGLNETGAPGDQDRKAKDLVRRAYLQSRPVLHMAHAFNVACTDVGPTLPGWDAGDFVLVMLANSEKWVWSAIDNAVAWREMSRFHMTPNLAPEHMIALSAPQKPAL